MRAGRRAITPYVNATSRPAPRGAAAARQDGANRHSYGVRPMQMTSNAMEKLFAHALRDLYFAENQIDKSFPRMIDCAKLPALKAALTEHHKETREQVKRLEQVFSLMKLTPQAVTCAAVKGILDEGEEIVKAFESSDACDASVIFACQAVEHYEINRYGTLKQWAKELGMKQAEKLLGASLDEEYAADDRLTKIAEKKANKIAEGKGARAA
jgi:ferritin-like metal-binding protein YciE